jgi:hypothetical protein
MNVANCVASILTSFQRKLKEKKRREKDVERIGVVKEMYSFSKEDDRTTAATKCKRSK